MELVDFCSAIELWSGVYTLLILIVVLVRWKDADKTTKLFAINMALIVFGIGVDTTIYLLGPNLFWLESLLDYLMTLGGIALTPIFAYYSVMMANSEKTIISKVWPRVVLAVSIVNVVITTILQIQGKLLQVQNNKMTFTNAIGITYLIESVASFITLVVLLCHAKKIKMRTLLAVLSMIIIPAIGLVMEITIPGCYLSYPTLSIAILIQYVVIQSHILNDAKLRAKIVRDMSETDVMTELKNRRAYTDFLDSLEETVDAGVAYFDVNGLKRTNDELGHVEGDKLINRFADILKKNLPFGKVFRISGDEFVAIYTGEDAQLAFEDEIEYVRKAIAANDDIAAIGTIYLENQNIEEIIRQAEKLMYVDKSEYYKRHGIDRRKR